MERVYRTSDIGVNLRRKEPTEAKPWFQSLIKILYFCPLGFKHIESIEVGLFLSQMLT